MIYHGKKEIENVHLDGRDISAVYYGELLVYELPKHISCYASGYWLDDNPWTDDTPWADTP